MSASPTTTIGTSEMAANTPIITIQPPAPTPSSSLDVTPELDAGHGPNVVSAPLPPSPSSAADRGSLNTLAVPSCLSLVSEVDSQHTVAMPMTTTYHVYNTGRLRCNLIFHTVPDRDLRIMIPGARLFNKFCASQSPWVSVMNKLDRERKPVFLDDPHSDPRQPSYFLHTPRISGHSPPQTLRLGGKHGAVVCLIDSTFFWRRWDLDFVVPDEDSQIRRLLHALLGKRKQGDASKTPKETEAKKEKPTPQRVDSGFGEGDQESLEDCDTLRNDMEGRVSLNAPGVIDPRGVLQSRYPVRSFSLPGETGREYIRQHNRQCKLSPRSDTKAASVQQQSADLPDHLTPTVPSLALTWNGWLTREYGFRYADIEFRWKGTGTVCDERKYWGKWSQYNHLKLVAYLPLEDAEKKSKADIHDEENEVKVGEEEECRGRAHNEDNKQEVCLGKTEEGQESATPLELRNKRAVILAKYISLLADRKAGRLTVFENGLQECFANEADQERLRHILVATAACMIRGEKEKRELLRDIVLTAATEGGGAV